MYRFNNLNRNHVKIGNSIIDLNKLKKKSPNIELEMKMKETNIDNKKKIKPLTFNF